MNLRHLRALTNRVALLTVPFGASLSQEADTTRGVEFGAFVDGYYAREFGQPATRDRSFVGGTPFTTQATRHNEFNVNLAFVEATLRHERVRGRLALQAGTAVQANYAAERPLARHIQEAVIGTRVLPRLWVDAGVFFSHVGMESWISRDNLTYTRSLVSEASPYYQSGVKVSWTPARPFKAQLHAVNGWQNISDVSAGPGGGLRFDWMPVNSLSLSGYNLLTMQPGNRLRALHGAGLKATFGATTLLAQADLGSQARSNSVGRTAHWYGFLLVARVQLSPSVSLSARGEHFDDDEQIVIVTSDAANSNPPFRGFAASAGLDVALRGRAIWRIELRGFRNDGAVFHGSGGAASPSSGLAVASLALRL